MSKCRLHLLSQIICAICSINTVNLKKVANTFGGKASTESNYRKLQRFFASADSCTTNLPVILSDYFLMKQLIGFCLSTEQSGATGKVKSIYWCFPSVTKEELSPYVGKCSIKQETPTLKNVSTSSPVLLICSEVRESKGFWLIENLLERIGLNGLNRIKYPMSFALKTIQ